MSVDTLKSPGKTVKAMQVVSRILVIGWIGLMVLMLLVPGNLSQVGVLGALLIVFLPALGIWGALKVLTLVVSSLSSEKPANTPESINSKLTASQQEQSKINKFVLVNLLTLSVSFGLTLMLLFAAGLSSDATGLAGTIRAVYYYPAIFLLGYDLLMYFKNRRGVNSKRYLMFVFLNIGYLLFPSILFKLILHTSL